MMVIWPSLRPLWYYQILRNYFLPADGVVNRNLREPHGVYHHSRREKFRWLVKGVQVQDVCIRSCLPMWAVMFKCLCLSTGLSSICANGNCERKRSFLGDASHSVFYSHSIWFITANVKSVYSWLLIFSSQRLVPGHRGQTFEGGRSIWPYNIHLRW